MIEQQREELKKKTLRRPHDRPGPQGHRQEHRRLRRVHRPGRHRRPAAHHRHVLGPHQSPQRNAQDRPGDRSQGSLDRQGQGKDRPGPQAEGCFSPWENIESKYPVGSVHEAEVVNIMSYGAFCKLEEGVEGLVHISEMSWTKRINHPQRSGHAGPEGRRSRSWRSTRTSRKSRLGMKQVEENPWERVAEKYPPGIGRQGQGPQHRQLRRVRRDRRRHRRPAARQRPVLDQEDRPPVSEVLKKGEDVAGGRARRRSGKAAHRPGPQADDEDPWLHAHPRPTTARAWSSRATSPRSPTSACSWNWSRASKACCTSREISDQKVEKPEDVRQGRPGGRSQDPPRRQRRAEDRPVPQARPVGPGRGEREEDARAERAEKRGLRGGLEGGEQTSGLGDLKIGE